MVRPELLSVVLRNEEHAEARGFRVHLVKVCIQIFSPEFDLSILIIEDANPVLSEGLCDASYVDAVFARERQTDIVFELFWGALLHVPRNLLRCSTCLPLI